MSFGQLAETTHFHLFTMPVVFLIMVHVLYLTMANQKVKVLVTWAAFMGVTLDLVSPWLITYVSPFFVFSLLAGDVLMVAMFLVMFVVPLHEMWIVKAPLMARGGDE